MENLNDIANVMYKDISELNSLLIVLKTFLDDETNNIDSVIILDILEISLQKIQLVKKSFKNFLEKTI
ncbi:hypothetical protein IJ732_00040 [bacterium]|nr:hypothetical protein [bacterium]